MKMINAWETNFHIISHNTGERQHNALEESHKVVNSKVAIPHYMTDVDGF